MRPTRVAGASLVLLLLSPAAWAQQASGIAGVARDTTGAVMPGVTVEAASPALIEKVRSVVTDGEGQYKIVDLRPGTYVVTFSLTGFNTIKREGIELTAGFTATVNAEMRVGAIEETVTVTASSPLVDVQNVRQQKVVSDEVFRALPTATISTSNIAAMIPGLVGTPNVGGATGITTQYSVGLTQTFHGKGGGKSNYDGMRTNAMETANGGSGYIISPATVEEWTVETGGSLAESGNNGFVVNAIPKEGGNSFRGSFSGLYSGGSLQSDNLTDALRARGLTAVNKVVYVYNVDGGVGGPIKQDGLWFFTAHRVLSNKNTLAGVYFNKTQGTSFYTPDLDRPGYKNDLLNSHAGRLTWRASEKNKVNFFADIQDGRTKRGTGAFTAPEAANHWTFYPTGPMTVTWNAPVTNRLLFEAGMGYMVAHWPSTRQPEAGPNDVSILDQLTGFVYNAPQFGLGQLGDPRVSDRLNSRFAVSYVTGTHAFKTGFQLEQGWRETGQELNNPEYPVLYRFRGSSPGAAVPNQITQVGTPYLEKERQKADLGIYAQDRWTVKRLTLNLGLRFDYLNAYVPEQHLPAGPFVPARDFAPVDGVPEWTDLNPRVGAAYDLFGDGRTALKVALGRYVGVHGTDVPSAANPVVTSVNTTNRTWNDSFYPMGDPRRGNYFPDCDLRNPAANGECGAIDNQNFGKNNPLATRYDDAVLRGFGVRDYFWEFGAEVQQQLGSRVSLTGGYYRNWYGNFTVTDNLEVTPTDFSPYCITAPVDSRLPGGGGYPVCGLYDVSATKFGKVTNLVVPASRYGKQTLVNDFVNVSVNTRLGSGMQLGGGVDTGRTVTDNCFVVDSPQQLLYCHAVTPFKAQTQVKLFGSYPLPGDFMVSGVFQNVAGPQIVANYPATNAQIAPSLGRNLSSGVNGTATVPLIEPRTRFEERRTQLDLRLSKLVKVGPKLRLRGSLDVYNVLNASSVLNLNTTYGSQWLQPIAGAILDGRFFQFGGELTF